MAETGGLIGGIQGDPGPAGPQGPQGVDGPAGPQGDQGPVGSQGPPGTNGTNGAVGPQGPAGNDGQDGAIGPQGAQGPAGNDGANGSSVLSGQAPPSVTDGNDGDFWIDTVGLNLYGPKTAGAWGAGSALVAAVKGPRRNITGGNRGIIASDFDTRGLNINRDSQPGTLVNINIQDNSVENCPVDVDIEIVQTNIQNYLVQLHSSAVTATLLSTENTGPGLQIPSVLRQFEIDKWILFNGIPNV